MAIRPVVGLALGAAVVVQGPVGWWLVGAVGGPRFLLAWIVGMATRVALVGLFALVIVVAVRPTSPTVSSARSPSAWPAVRR
jgi:hypothetical protein